MLNKFSLVGVCCGAIALAQFLTPPPAKALAFNWTFNDKNTSGSPVSGTIDLPGTSDGLYTTGVTATVTQFPSSFGSQSFSTFVYDSGAGINLQNGSIDTNYMGFIRLKDGGGSGSGNLDFFGTVGTSTNVAKLYVIPGFVFAQSDSPATFTAVPAPLPLLGLGAATAFSRKLKQRIALRRKREEVGAAV